MYSYPTLPMSYLTAYRLHWKFYRCYRIENWNDFFEFVDKNVDFHCKKQLNYLPFKKKKV